MDDALRIPSLPVARLCLSACICPIASARPWLCLPAVAVGGLTDREVSHEIASLIETHHNQDLCSGGGLYRNPTFSVGPTRGQRKTAGPTLSQRKTECRSLQ